MEIWQILLIIGAGTVPFIVIAILVEAAVGSDSADKRSRRQNEERAVIPWDLD